MKQLKRYLGLLILGFVVSVGLAHSVLGVTTMSKTALGVNNSSVLVTNGKIGVGTPTPTYTLDVRGNFLVTVNAAGAGNIYSTMNYVVGGTVDWSVAPYQEVSVGNGGLSVSFVNPSGPCGLLLVIKRTGTGVVTFPSVLWQGAVAPSMAHSEQAAGSSGLPVYDILGLYYDGVNYYGEVNLDFK
jgi:hypothetical protein